MLFKTMKEHKKLTVLILIPILVLIFILSCFLVWTRYSKGKEDEHILNRKEWKKKNEDNRIKVFSFNIKNGGESIFSEESRRPRILELLKEYYPDVIGYQEVTKNWINWFDTEAFTEVYSYYGKPRDPNKESSEYSLIMYNHEKFTLKDSGDFWLNEDVAADPSSTSTKVGWDASHTRICSWVLLEDKATNTQFVVMNTHFDHKGQVAKTESAKLVLKMADQWEVPVIITGDLNSSETSSVYQTMLGGNYDNAKYIASSTMSWATSPGFFSKGTQFGEVIDHIFIRKSTFPVEEYKVIKEDYSGGRVSDHFPVMAVFTIG